MLFIGIDTGKNTGFAVWDSIKQEFQEISTYKIHRAMERVLEWVQTGSPVIVYFEDARKRQWFGSDKGRAQLQGAGSIKRDAVIWEDFLKDKGIAFVAIPPVKGATKWSVLNFNQVTKWTKRTTEHARDAALLVYNRKDTQIPQNMV